VIAVVHHPDYLAQPRSTPPYQPGKNALIRDLLQESGRAVDWIEPELMPIAWLEAVHDPAYVAEVVEARVPALKERRIGFGVTQAVARRAQRVPGGTFLAGLIAMQRGFAANSAGGSHHALAGTGAGYCVFNDLAVAAVRLTQAGHARRVLVVDCDVHQGDGTAALTAGRADIATYSIHAEKNFPARKARSTIDVGLADGTGDDLYLRVLGDTLRPLIDDFGPDLLLYQAGVDPFVHDRLGRLALSQAGLDARDRLVAALARERGIGLASTPGGGYGPDAREIARRHVQSIFTLGEALANFVPIAASRVEDGRARV
jgi:acetoin utilization deacetylase AcuC-like enzyme